MMDMTYETDHMQHVPSDQFDRVRHEREEMEKKFGMPKGSMTKDMMAVDLNDGFVPTEKDDEGNLKMAADNIRCRFGLDTE